jgi:predicted chitinase
MNDTEMQVFLALKDGGFNNYACAAIMGVTAKESGFKTFKETSFRNTSAERIRAVFPTLMRGVTDQQIDTMKKSDNLFFGYVYGGRYGNQAYNPNADVLGITLDGYRYVGRGFNGITFRDNYAKIGKEIGVDLVANPELLETPTYAAKALGVYFKPYLTLDKSQSLEMAFNEAYRANAGVGYSFTFYANSTNPVHVSGIKNGRKKADEYLHLINVMV